jgi:hypothetical protein
VIWRRVLAGFLAAFWGLVWFGLIDLLTAVLRDPDFTQGYALELGWGLFHLVLVAGPLVALLVRPRAHAPVAMLAVATAAVLAAALWGWSGRVALEGLGLLATTLLMGRPAFPRGRPAPVPAVLALVAAPFALWYAATWVNAMDRTPSLDDITNGISHYPLQGAFAFALLGNCALVAFTRSRFAALSVAFCAVAFGVESLIDPGLDASLGTLGGVLLLLWGAAVAASVLPRNAVRLPG